MNIIKLINLELYNFIKLCNVRNSITNISNIDYIDKFLNKYGWYIKAKKSSENIVMIQVKNKTHIETTYNSYILDIRNIFNIKIIANSLNNVIIRDGILIKKYWSTVNKRWTYSSLETYDIYYTKIISYMSLTGNKKVININNYVIYDNNTDKKFTYFYILTSSNYFEHYPHKRNTFTYYGKRENIITSEFIRSNKSIPTKILGHKIKNKFILNKYGLFSTKVIKNIKNINYIGGIFLLFLHHIF